MPRTMPRSHRPALPHRDRSSSAPNVCMNLVNVGNMHAPEVRYVGGVSSVLSRVSRRLLQPVVARRVRLTIGVNASIVDARRKVAVHRRGLGDHRLRVLQNCIVTGMSWLGPRLPCDSRPHRTPPPPPFVHCGTRCRRSY